MSGEAAFRAVKYGLAGLVIGTTTSALGDMIYQKLVAQTMQKAMAASNTNLGGIAGVALNAVLAGAFGSLVIYAGDQVFESVVGDDFLGHLIFYQSAFLTSGSLRAATGSIQMAVNQLVALDASIVRNHTSPQSGTPIQTGTPPGAPTKPKPISVETAPAQGITELYAVKSSKTSSCVTGMCGGSLFK
jgi:hypothetical protein